MLRAPYRKGITGRTRKPAFQGATEPRRPLQEGEPFPEDHPGDPESLAPALGPARRESRAPPSWVTAPFAVLPCVPQLDVDEAAQNLPQVPRRASQHREVWGGPQALAVVVSTGLSHLRDDGAAVVALGALGP